MSEFRAVDQESMILSIESHYQGLFLFSKANHGANTSGNDLNEDSGFSESCHSLFIKDI